MSNDSNPLAAAAERTAISFARFGDAWKRIDPAMARHQQATRRVLSERVRRWNGLRPCCGATNAPCGSLAADVYETFTGCEVCGHPRSCHAPTPEASR